MPSICSVLLTEIFSKAEELGRKARLRTLKDRDAAALQTSAACAVLLDSHVPDAQGRAVAFAGIPRCTGSGSPTDRSAGPPTRGCLLPRTPDPIPRVRRFLPCIFIGDVGESPSPSTGRDRPIQPWSAETGA